MNNEKNSLLEPWGVKGAALAAWIGIVDGVAREGAAGAVDEGTSGERDCGVNVSASSRSFFVLESDKLATGSKYKNKSSYHIVAFMKPRSLKLIQTSVSPCRSSLCGMFELR